jgi:transformation/transcription domain-associated protein
LIKTLIQGIKPILTALRACNPSAPTVSENEIPYASGFSVDETRIFVNLLKDGLQCFDYFITDSFGADGSLIEKNADKTASSVAKEDKEVFEAFAAIFTYVEPSLFQEIFASQISYMFDRILVNPGLQAMPQYLLGLVNVAPNFVSAATNFVTVSPNFAGLLLRFLVDNLDKLGAEDQVYSGALLRLFKVVFMAVTKYPEQNELVLRPHVGTIILKSMRLSAKAKEPLNYFLLLRSLFRSIGGGRFDALYSEVLPLLEVLLEGLNTLLATAHKQQMRELFVELCLTVPVRLSVLLPYLSFLMKPLVLALQAGPELVSQGLRTLELCIDNLTQDFLEPIMSPVIGDLMSALWKHLKPLPYKTEHSHTTLRILGKLGGRNRRLLNEATNLSSKANSEIGIEALFKFNGLEDLKGLPLDEALNVAEKILENSGSSVFYQEQAFFFARSCIPLLIDARDLTGFPWKTSRQITEDTSSTEALMDIDSSSKSESDKDEISPFIDPPSITRVKKEAQDVAVMKLLHMLILSTTVMTVKDEACSILNDLCHFFALVCLSEAFCLRNEKKPPHNPPLIDMIINSPSSRIDGFVDAVVFCMASENTAIRTQTEAALVRFGQDCRSILASSSDLSLEDIHVFHTLALKFCSSCYRQEWFKKNAGCLGISLLTSQLDLGPKWILDHELDFVKALLYVLKDTSPEMATSNVEEATKTLFHVLKMCNSSRESGEVSDRLSKFNSLISLLISELSNSNNAVRETIQASFQLLADLTETAVTDLLLPVRDRLLSPIFSKPLRALPFAMQIGHIDAITYCLSLRPPLLSFSDELVRLLHEALALADAEDQALVSKPTHYKNSASLTNLRVVCIKLLSAAMGCPDFSSQKQSTTRGRIISVFFKSLYAKSVEVVEVAYKGDLNFSLPRVKRFRFLIIASIFVGLQQVLTQQHKLPKDLLQQGLKPILVNLSDYKRLTVPALEGLARLLELLTNYFKVEIGRKLLDHLRQWADPAILENAAGRPLSEIEEIKIIIAILNVFYLLPASANIFLDDLISVILDLEGKLRRSISSPFRLPLIKFINRYPAEALDYFLDRLNASAYSNLFIDILGHGSAEVMRHELMSNAEKLAKACFSTISETRYDSVAYYGAKIIEQISSFDCDWLLQHPNLIAHLRDYWTLLKNRPEDFEHGFNVGNEYQLCLRLFIHVCKLNRNDVDTLYLILDGFSSPMVLDISYLKNFLYEEVAVLYEPTQKKAIFEHFLGNLAKSSVPDSTNAIACRMLIVPMLVVAFQRGQVDDIIDAGIIKLYHNLVWQPVVADNWEVTQKSDFLKVELLQLTILLVEYAHHTISELRKDIIKYLWNHLKIEDITCKHAAYVTLSRFIQEFETPAKIVIQIFVALLRAHQAEARTLVKQGLDILLPALPKRLANAAQYPTADSKLPAWVRWTRKIIIDDGYSVSQLLTIYQILIRHSDLFFDNKEYFVSHIVTSLPKLGLSPNCTPETKAVTIDLCELILKWERQTISTTESAHDAMEGIESNTGDSYSSLKEQCITYLIRFVSATKEPSLSPLVQRCTELMKSFISIWPDVDVKLSNFEKSFAVEVNDDNISIVSNSMELLVTILQVKPSNWILKAASALQKCVENWIKIEHTAVVRSLKSVLTIVYKAFAVHDNPSLERTPEVVAFTKVVESVIFKGIQNMTNLFAVVSYLSAAYEYRPEMLEDRILSDVMRLLQKLTKDILLQESAPLAQTSGDSISEMLVVLLHILKRRVTYIKDHRRTFNECLLQLVAESTDVSVLRTILIMVKEWTFNTQDSFPTIKEKANLMVKMMVLESRGDRKLYEEYLSLVASIYADSRFSRTELTVRLERAFLMGTKCENATIRRRFADIFSSSMDVSLFFRMNYIIGVQNWEYVSDSFWLRQALELLLDAIDSTKPLSDFAPRSRISLASDDQKNENSMDVDPTSSENQHLDAYIQFARSANSFSLASLIQPLKELLFVNVDLTASLWANFFPLCWSVLSTSERQCISRLIIPLLAKDYHLKQAGSRPNVIQSILEGLCNSYPTIDLPPQLIKYAGKTFNAWYIALELLQGASAVEKLTDSVGAGKEEDVLRENNLDTLAQMFELMSEDDYFFGLWRRRCVFAETNLAVSYEQSGLWSHAQHFLETAQMKARSGVLPFSESEYVLWEEHWVQCAERLQQWDLLTDLAKHEGNSELLLECAWRLSDWVSDREFLETTVRSLSDVGATRKKVTLQVSHDGIVVPNESSNF